MATMTDRGYLIGLRQTLETRFSESELRTLCFDLGIDYETLPGANKPDKARELLIYCDHHDRIADLVTTGKGLRPDVPWRDRSGLRSSNPYCHRGPIRDPSGFYGHPREVRTTLTLLANVQSISVVGPRRIGKSSLLRYISNPSVIEKHGLSPRQFAFVSMSCEQLSDLGRDQILQLMINQARAGMNRAGFQVDPGGAPTSAITFFDFSDALARLTQLGAKLVFLLDEFEYLAGNSSLAPAFFAGLRSIAGNLDVAYVTASSRSLLDLTYADKSVLGSPFFNIFSTIRLGLFEDNDARGLISEPSFAAGVEFSNATVEFILSLTDHHPFFIQVACFHAFEAQSEKGVLSDADYPLLRERVESELTSQLQYTWDHLGQEAQQVLLASETAWADPKFGNVLELLNDQGVICRTDNQFRWCALWADFVKSQVLTSAGSARAGGTKPPHIPKKPNHVPDSLL